MRIPGPPPQRLQQLGLLAGPEQPLLPAGMALGLPQPSALSGDSAPATGPQAGPLPVQGSAVLGRGTMA